MVTLNPNQRDSLRCPRLLAERTAHHLASGLRPRRPGILVITVCYLFRLRGAVGIDDEDVLRTIERPADAVELVLETRDVPRSALAILVFFVGLVRHARRERDARTVGRPLGVLDTLLQLGEPERLTTLSRDHVELRFRLVVAAVGNKSQALPVR